MNKADAIRAMLDGKEARYEKWLDKTARLKYDRDNSRFLHATDNKPVDLSAYRNDGWEIYTPPQETVLKYGWAAHFGSGSTLMLSHLYKDKAEIRKRISPSTITGVTFHKLKVDDEGHIYVEVVK